MDARDILFLFFPFLLSACLRTKCVCVAFLNRPISFTHKPKVARGEEGGPLPTPGRGFFFFFRPQSPRCAQDTAGRPGPWRNYSGDRPQHQRAREVRGPPARARTRGSNTRPRRSRYTPHHHHRRWRCTADPNIRYTARARRSRRPGRPARRTASRRSCSRARCRAPRARTTSVAARGTLPLSRSSPL